LDEFEFLNYGYVSLDAGGERLNLEGEEEIYRTNIQLYHHVASAIPLQGQEVLEVGCGHGGGAAYVMRSLRPRRMEGIDLSEGSIQLCSERYPLEGLTFRTGDALALPHGNEEFDAVLNIESSHAYPSTGAFLREVHRVLRPGGHLLFADLRYAKKIPQLWRDVERSGMKIIKEEDITANVLKARDEFTRQMAEKMRSRMRWFGSFALSWLGATDSLAYRYLQTGRFKYLFCVMQKPE
jgi:ubiquinone/menaquinone biosynthesis C-methylase UbiE